MLAATLAAGPLAHAADAPAPKWQGVWKGTIGTLPVQACFRRIGDSFERGAYFYLSSKRLIGLESDKGTWVENAAKSGGESGRWSIAIAADDTLRGDWKGGGKTLPVVLRRIGTADDQDESCASRTFIAPRLTPSKVIADPAKVPGLAYSSLRYEVPASFSEVSLRGFTYTPSQPGDPKIIAALKLQPDISGGRGDYGSCMQGAIGMLGNDGDYSREVDPEWATPAFLSVYDSEGGFCGGAHPSYGYTRELWDRQSGKRVDLAQWFTKAGISPGNGTYISSVQELTPALRAVVVRYFKTDESECKGAVDDQEFWGVAVSPTGFVFTPSLPHVIMACTDDAHVPFAAISRYLSPVGKAQLARLRAGGK
ncbi:MAG: hypothetical protein ACKOPQ_10690 [Novosphingobium sp.]